MRAIGKALGILLLGLALMVEAGAAQQGEVVLGVEAGPSLSKMQGIS